CSLLSKALYTCVLDEVSRETMPFSYIICMSLSVVVYPTSFLFSISCTVLTLLSPCSQRICNISISLSVGFISIYECFRRQMYEAFRISKKLFSFFFCYRLSLVAILLKRT